MQMYNRSEKLKYGNDILSLCDKIPLLSNKNLIFADETAQAVYYKLNLQNYILYESRHNYNLPGDDGKLF